MKPILLLDTNIVARFLIKDNPLLSEKAAEIFKRAEQNHVLLYVHEIIVAEVIWLLSKVYKAPRKRIAKLIEEFLCHEFVINEQKNLLIKAIHMYNTSNFSFPDCFLYTYKESTEFVLETFDKKLKRFRVSQKMRVS